ncbi:MAG: hypothetical protein WD342_08080 [Verrucomicrobiales bacterium]
MNRVRDIVERLEFTKTAHGDRTFYWPRGVDPGKWNTFRVAGEEKLDIRTADDLPPEEIAAGARSVLQAQVSLTKEGLVAETSRLLGYSRTGSKLNERIREAIDLLLSSGIAEQE